MRSIFFAQSITNLLFMSHSFSFLSHLNLSVFTTSLLSVSSKKPKVALFYSFGLMIFYKNIRLFYRFPRFFVFPSPSLSRSLYENKPFFL